MVNNAVPDVEGFPVMLREMFPLPLTRVPAFAEAVRPETPDEAADIAA